MFLTKRLQTCKLVNIRWIVKILIITIITLNTIKTNEINSIPLNIYKRVPAFVSNISTIVGESISFNCSLYLNDEQKRNIINYSPDIKLNPTWLKADVIYNQNGFITTYKTENIIVTRKGIIIDNLRDKMKLTTSDQFQTLKLNNINIKNEGKYICRGFSSDTDKLFYLNVYAGVTGLGMKFTSNSKYFRVLQPGSSTSDDENSIKGINYSNSLTSSISIKENDELIVNCSVSSSKPAANLSVWIIPNHRSSSEEDTRKLDFSEYYNLKNKDSSQRTIGITRFVVNRFDNLKSVTCIAENTALDEKWESKKILNVLYSPKCSKYQKLIYNTGINQTIELECRMTDANPPYLDFNWILTNDQANRDKSHSNGFTSRMKFTPKSLNDFGEISCLASNGLENGECKMQLELGGPPNPPIDCFHKENNKTIIIECKPGFDQGDPEVYFYLLKKKTNGNLVEYARKRDSCSFLISNLILEEHLNDFFIYSSNKYGNNKEQSTKLTIENKEFLLKSLDQLQETSNQNNKRISVIAVSICGFLSVIIVLICVLVKCHNDGISNKKLHYSSESGSSYRENPVLNPYRNQETYKYSSHLNNYNTKGFKMDSKFHQNLKKKAEEKADYSITSNESVTTSEFDTGNVTTNPIYDNNGRTNMNLKNKIMGKLNVKNIRTPSLINNIQDLDMSPKSKRLVPDRNRELNLCSRSLTDETAETDSENYIDFSQQKLQLNKFNEDKTSLSDDPKIDYYSPINENHQKSNGNLNKLNTINYNLINIRPLGNLNVWYNNDSDYSGLSVDKSVVNQAANSILKISDYSNFNRILNGKLATNSDFDEDLEEKKLFQWPKNNIPLFSNDTSSLDVDDEKVVGILV